MTPAGAGTESRTLRLHLERDGGSTPVELVLPDAVRADGGVMAFDLPSGDVQYLGAAGGLAGPTASSFALLPGVEQELHVEVLRLRGTVTAWVVVFDQHGARTRTVRARVRRGLLRLELGTGEPGEAGSFALRLADAGTLEVGRLRLVPRPTFCVPSAATCLPPTTSSSSAR